MGNIGNNYFLCIIALTADFKLLIFRNGVVMGMQIMLAIDEIEKRKRKQKNKMQKVQFFIEIFNVYAL